MIINLKERFWDMDFEYYNSLPPLLTVKEMAAILRIGRNTAYRLVKSGKIHGVYYGRSIRIPRKSLKQFLELTQ